MGHSPPESPPAATPARFQSADGVTNGSPIAGRVRSGRGSSCAYSVRLSPPVHGSQYVRLSDVTKASVGRPPPFSVWLRAGTNGAHGAPIDRVSGRTCGVSGEGKPVATSGPRLPG